MEKLVKRASEFAYAAHEGQLYGGAPYTIHLSDVYAILCEYGVRDQNILASAWLHDILEETKITYSELKDQFFHTVAELVYCVTDELGRNRKERHQKTFPKLQENPNAIILKQADRLSNGTYSYISGDPRFLMYKREYKEFRGVLMPHGGLKDLWDVLDTVFSKEISNN